MTTLATCHTQDTTTEGTLFVAFELSEKTWKLGFTTGHGQKPRERTVTARQQERVLDEIAQAKRRLGLPETAPVVSCYEAGREGFWLHRFLPHSTELRGEVCHRSAKASGGEDLQVEKPVSCWDCASFHFHATVAGMLGPTLIRDEVV
jgi:hypothetical protein